MSGESSSFPVLRHQTSRFLSSCHIIISVLILFLILNACSHRQATGRSTATAAGSTAFIDSDKDSIDRYVGSIGGATSLPGLQMIGLSIKDSGLPKSAKDELHGIYANKKRDLESMPE